MGNSLFITFLNDPAPSTFSLSESVRFNSRKCLFDWDSLWQAIGQLISTKVCCFAPIKNVTYSYVDACRNIFNAIKMRRHTSLEKNIPLTLFERVRNGYERYYLWEVSWRLNRLATYCPPPTLLAITAYLSHSPGLLNRRPGGQLLLGHGFHSSIFLQLIWPFCRRGYIIIWHPPTSCERHNSLSIQPFVSKGCSLISSTGCTCYLHRCISSFVSLDGVNMLHKFSSTFHIISIS